MHCAEADTMNLIAGICWTTRKVAEIERGICGINLTKIEIKFNSPIPSGFRIPRPDEVIQNRVSSRWILLVIYWLLTSECNISCVPDIEH